MLWISATWIGLPLWEWAWRIGVKESRFSLRIHSCNQGRDSERSDTTSLSVLLLSLCQKFGKILYWRIIVIVKSERLGLDPALIGKNPPISSETRVCYKNIPVKLDNLLNSSAFLKFSDSFFLNEREFTSTAKMTAFWVTSPTEHKPFLTASIAYSTWNKWPFGENTVIAESYIFEYILNLSIIIHVFRRYLYSIWKNFNLWDF